MEIFVTDQYVQFIIDDFDRNYGMAFLKGKVKSEKANMLSRFIFEAGVYKKIENCS